MIAWLVGVALAAPRLVVDGPLVEAVPCEEPAPAELVAALRDGVSLR